MVVLSLVVLDIFLPPFSSWTQNIPINNNPNGIVRVPKTQEEVHLSADLAPYNPHAQPPPPQLISKNKNNSNNNNKTH